MAPPRWPDEQGRLIPTYPCPRCGREVASRFRGFRVENLRHLGWAFFQPTSYRQLVRTCTGDHPDASGGWAGYICAGVGGGALIGWPSRAPQERASYACPL